MAAIRFINDCTLDITPLFEKNFIFISCRIEESILGELPELVLTLKTDQDICQINDEVKGTLTNEKGNSTRFVGYVYSISYNNNNSIIKILCVKPEFVKEEATTKFTSMSKAIKALYFGDIESNTQSDLMNQMEIYQMDTTNYKLLKRCLSGYKKNAVYGFALGSLRIHDLSNWESKMTLASRINLHSVSPSELTDPKLYHKESKIIDYSKGKDPNHKIIKFYDTYIPVNKEYEDFISNILYNRRFLVMKNISNFTTRELFPLNITDGVEVGDSTKNVKRCFISHRVIEFDANNLKVSYTIQSIDPL